MAFAIDAPNGVVRRARIGLGGVAATPVRARAAERLLEGRPWLPDTVRMAAAALAGEGTPMDDHRASAGYRSAMLEQAMLKLYAETTGELRAAHVMSSLSERPVNPVVGTRIPHEGAVLHVTGRALYTDDLAVRGRAPLTAWPVQATHAHAFVTALRTEPALRVPGVVRVLTSADVPGINDAGIKHDEPLFPTEVMFHGHALCWVLGESAEAARLGAAAVEVDYEPLPSLVTVADALAAGSLQGSVRTVRRGDARAALASAPRVFEGVSETGGQEHFYLETQAALADIDDDGQVFVQCSTQHPSETQAIVAHVLGVSSNAVTVQNLRMGGAFGGKEMQPHGFAAIAALGSLLTGRPVRLRLNRTQDITMTGKRHPFHATWRVGFTEDGKLLGLQAELTADGGWSLDLSEPVLGRALCHIDNAYWIPNIEVLGRIAKTNKTSQTAFRGFGGPQGMFVIEDILGRCAPGPGDRPGRTAPEEFLCPGPDHALRPNRPARRTARGDLGPADRRQRPGAPARRDRRVQRVQPAPETRPGDHAGQVRDLVQLPRVQPGGRAGARLQGRVAC